jgi:hypothetical protein
MVVPVLWLLLQLLHWGVVRALPLLLVLAFLCGPLMAVGQLRQVLLGTCGDV